MINPTNIKDKATEEEIKIIDQLTQQDQLGEKNIKRSFEDTKAKRDRENANAIKATLT